MADPTTKSSSLDKDGYGIFPVANLERLLRVRQEIYLHVARAFDLEGCDPAFAFNMFHTLHDSLSDGQFNERRVSLIKSLTEEMQITTEVFNCWREVIVGLIGPDVLGQKSVNLVIQEPLNPNPSELHRDAPANSSYEIVVWIPLVDCYASKAMFIVDAEKSRLLVKALRRNEIDWAKFEEMSRVEAAQPPVKFGEALIFHTGCLHGSDVNRESETRFSLNLRYKNLFSPPGLKSQLQFFSPVAISNVVRLGSLLEADELL